MYVYVFLYVYAWDTKLVVTSPDVSKKMSCFMTQEYRMRCYIVSQMSAPSTQTAADELISREIDIISIEDIIQNNEVREA